MSLSNEIFFIIKCFFHSLACLWCVILTYTLLCWAINRTLFNLIAVHLTEFTQHRLQRILDYFLLVFRLENSCLMPLPFYLAISECDGTLNKYATCV